MNSVATLPSEFPDMLARRVGGIVCMNALNNYQKMKISQRSSVHCFTEGDNCGGGLIVSAKESSTQLLQQRILLRILRKQSIQSDTLRNLEVKTKEQRISLTNLRDQTKDTSNFFSAPSQGGFTNPCSSDAFEVFTSSSLVTKPHDNCKLQGTIGQESPILIRTEEANGSSVDKAQPQQKSLKNLLTRISQQIQGNYSTRKSQQTAFPLSTHNATTGLASPLIKNTYVSTKPNSQHVTGILIQKRQQGIQQNSNDKNQNTSNIQTKQSSNVISHSKKGSFKLIFPSKDENSFCIPKNQFQYHYVNVQPTILAGFDLNRNVSTKTNQEPHQDQQECPKEQQHPPKHHQRKRSQAISLMNGGHEDILLTKLIQSHRNFMQTVE